MVMNDGTLLLVTKGRISFRLKYDWDDPRPCGSNYISIMLPKLDCGLLELYAIAINRLRANVEVVELA